MISLSLEQDSADRNKRGFEVLRGNGFAIAGRQSKDLSFWETAELINNGFNFMFPAPRTLDMYRPPPTTHSGIQKHELLIAYELASHHRSKTTSVEPKQDLMTLSVLKFDGKLLNPGAAVSKNDIVGVQHANGNPVTISEIRHYVMKNQRVPPLFFSLRQRSNGLTQIFKDKIRSLKFVSCTEIIGMMVNSSKGYVTLIWFTQQRNFGWRIVVGRSQVLWVSIIWIQTLQMRVIWQQFLREFLNVQCAACTSHGESDCVIWCEVCFTEQNVCDECFTAGYRGSQWHWAARPCLSCLQRGSFCNIFHFLIISSDMEGMNVKAMEQLHLDGLRADCSSLSFNGIWDCPDAEHIFKNVMKSAMNWILCDDTFFSFRILKTFARCPCPNGRFQERFMKYKSKKSIVAQDATCTSDLIRLVWRQNERIFQEVEYAITTAVPETVRFV